MNHTRRSHVLPTLGLALAMSAANRHAQSAPPAARPALAPGNGKLLLTVNASSIGGAAGGGLTPWAMIGSYATKGAFSGTSIISHATTLNDTLGRFGPLR